MKGLLYAEFYHLRRSRWFHIMLVADVLISIVFVFAAKDAHPLPGRTVLRSALIDLPLMMMLCAIFAGLYIGPAFTNKTVARAITAGHSRTRVMLAKCIVYLIATAVILLVYPLLSSGMACARAGWGVTITWGECISVARVIALAVLLNAAVCMLFAFLSFMLQDTGKAIGTSVVVYLLLTILATPRPALPVWLNGLLVLLPTNIARDVAFARPLSAGLAWQALAGGVVCLVLLLLLTGFAFNRSELK
ncbi:MAG: hypothetical protein LBS17_02985 [Actinomycetes bacterium]|jgi:ABC-2 type transport system permease protein|nr:hypothetical protein [Actinomycetes bacterium]